MMRKIIMACLFFLLCCIKGKTQGFNISGYVDNYTMIVETDPKITDRTLWQNITRNKLNAEWRFNEHLQIEVGMRNHLICGNDDVTKVFKQVLRKNENLLNLSWQAIDKKGVMANLALERCVLQWSANQWEVKVGRQRINWGQTFVWNPNDVFRTSPFVTLYYPEYSGCDAIRTTYYHNETARSELAASVDCKGKPTVAFLHNNHLGETDFQVMGGVYKGNSMVLGGGLSTSLKNSNIRMESSYFHNFKAKGRKTDIVQIVLGADRIFPNSLTLQGEVLYTNNVVKINTEDIWERSFLKYSARQLTISHWSFAGSIYYPFTAQCSIKAITGYWLDHRAIYADLELKYQITQNLQVSAIAHTADYNDDPLRVDARMGTLRLKWNF
ncbi:hypothetical protein [Prevotella sp. OH937_COT-195]|uniref:hypothetical protein n=1 Tax=Prevotella sp. OH937_COT-195 TaxID=2491051 RepID=UPI000F650ED9|nr:hypothetical protein [Prevotella sp. OH937_COT-195]RRD02716.1 hypothetical protein EII32_01515 [Prevotella sp. OH937_COT-195]